MAGVIVLIVAIVAELIVITAVKRGTWSPITGLAVSLLVLGVLAAAWTNRQAVINGAARFWTWVQANVNELLKWLLVATFFIVTIWMFWTMAVKAVETGEIRIPLTSTSTGPADVSGTVVITPETPFVFRVEPRHQLDYFGGGVRTIRRDGADLIITYSVKEGEKAVAKYEYFRCTPQRPCADVEMPITPQ